MYNYKINKLVRDKSVAKLINKGANCKWEELNDADFMERFNEKLIELINLYMYSKSAELLADIEIVIAEIIRLKGISAKEYQQLKSDNISQKGGYQQKILLKEIISKAPEYNID